MLTDWLVQLYDQTPRRPTSVYLLLRGKKTLSVLFAALQHDQLRWLQLHPTLARTDYQAAMTHLLEAGVLQETAAGVVVADEQARLRATQTNPLPVHFAPWQNLAVFVPRFYLAVQVVSEASFNQAAYAPVVKDWVTQQWVRRWWQTWRSAGNEVVGAMTAAFEHLPQKQADLLAQQLVGHDYSGRPEAQTTHQGQLLEAFATLVTHIAAHPEWRALQTLWGGPKALLSPSNQKALTLLQQGASKAAIGQRLRLKPSTVNEHLLTAALFGAELPLEALYTPAQHAALSAVQAPQTPYQELLANIATVDFFQVRLFQILSLQGRWPHDA